VCVCLHFVLYVERVQRVARDAGAGSRYNQRPNPKWRSTRGTQRKELRLTKRSATFAERI